MEFLCMKVKDKKPMEDKIMKKMFIAAIAAIAILTGTANIAAQHETNDVGGWTEPEISELTPEMQQIFDEATAKLIGMNCRAIRLLGREIVNGTNYRFLAESQPIYPGSQKKTVIITIYQDLAGNAKILDVDTN